MNAPRTCAAALVVACALAVVWPVRPIFPKRNAAGGLVVHTRTTGATRDGSLDPELLDDLPRIHPDGRGRIALVRDRGTTVLRGAIADPYGGEPGVAVFAIVDGRRVPDAPTRFDGETFRIALVRGSGDPRRLAVGLVAYDERGYFRLDYLPRR